MEAWSEAQLALGLVTLLSLEEWFKGIVVPKFLHALPCRFCMLCTANFFSYMLRAANRHALSYRFFSDDLSQNWPLILLFFLFFQLPVCLRNLFAGMVLCALIRHPLAGHSVLYSLSFLQFLLIIFCKREQMFSPPPLSGAGNRSFRAGLHQPVPQPMRGALFPAEASA